MLRYLRAAFLARPRVPGLGAVPTNLLAVGAFAVLGAANPAFWLLGLGLETAYLFGLSSNGRFRRAVDADRPGARPAGDAAPPLEVLLRQLGQAERRRLERLQELLGKVLALYAQFQVDEFMAQHNRDSLRTLGQHFARLLLARGNIERYWSGDAREIADEAAGIEADLRRDGLTPELRASKTRTLEILQARLENQTKKGQILDEIESELRRIEARFELALENAAMSGQPRSVSAELGFDLSRLDAAVVGAVPAALPEPGPASPTRTRPRVRGRS